MWLFLCFLCLAAVQGTSAKITVTCETFGGFSPRSSSPPSKVFALKVTQVEDQDHYVLNISWAINIDASIDKLEGTVIESSSEELKCTYSPSIAKTDLTGLEQIWFHYLLYVTHGVEIITVHNFPLPSLGHGLYQKTSVLVPTKAVRTTPSETTAFLASVPSTETTEPDPKRTNIWIIFLGITVALVLLSSCFVISYICRPNIATRFGFKRLFPPPTVPVPVLIVYPAENSAFQLAIVELAEFLQCHGGCKVAIDMWQQEKIAEQGPMRWLAEQVTAADSVLIVSPLAKNTSPQLSFSNPQNNLPVISIPAATHDLYPLILNMVASQAKNASELSKFWVLQLDKKKRSNDLPLELRTCEAFCLMNDLNKLCKKIHGQTSNRKKLSFLQLRRGVDYSEKSTMKLRQAVERNGGKQQSSSKENCLLSPEGSPV
ncbi:interleukin-17 receptor B [Oryzias melastigma]|uniref:Interleukin 17 receptor B n=1 Tax=Oryzias melastigma TaxID=30732 RepID=A0A3B3BK36_ORYME|nr:interleukin-17 receptor B [Oryzias melastigma]